MCNTLWLFKIFSEGSNSFNDSFIFLRKEPISNKPNNTTLNIFMIISIMHRLRLLFHLNLLDGWHINHIFNLINIYFLAFCSLALGENSGPLVSEITQIYTSERIIVIYRRTWRVSSIVSNYCSNTIKYFRVFALRCSGSVNNFNNRTQLPHKFLLHSRTHPLCLLHRTAEFVQGLLVRQLAVR